MTGEWRVEGLETDLDHFHLGPIELTMAPGHAVAVLGPSGAGKTTFLRTLAGFLRLRKGRILRDGEDISDYLPEERSLGYVPQGLGLIPQRNVERNVRYPLEVRGSSDATRRTRELLNQFHLTPLAHRYPSRLSGGEQQRVAIARALAADPSLIVWDEPWQGLDVVARHELGLALHELRAVDRVPIVLVTHDPGLAFSIADSFLVLEEGRVREQCDTAQLLERPGDAFAARFIGLENVYSMRELEGGPVSGLRAFLRARAGAEGVGFAAPVLPAPETASAGWEGAVRSVRPGPTGLIVEVESDELMVVLRLPPPMRAPLPTVGSTVPFVVDGLTVHGLGSRGVGDPGR